MRITIRLAAVGAGAVLGLSAWVAPVAAGAEGLPGPHFGGDHVVFVQTDNTAGNQVVAYDRAHGGSLTLANTYDTRGLGGQLSGSVVDHLASQGSLTYDQDNALLYAVNAGSNTVSVFSVRGDQLTLRQVVGSGGTFPVSVAVHGHLVYVLNAEKGGSVQGYVALAGHLFPLPGSNRALGLNPSATPQYVNTPGQVAFSPDGSQLIVTTKANGNDIDVFSVGFFGWLSSSPVVNAEPGTVPFGISFDGAGHLVIANAGNDSLANLHPQPERDRVPHRFGGNGPGGDMLGRASAGALLRLQRRERDGERVPGGPQWQSHAPHPDDGYRPRNGRRLGLGRRSVPLRPDRRQRDRR